MTTHKILSGDVSTGGLNPRAAEGTGRGGQGDEKSSPPPGTRYRFLLDAFWILLVWGKHSSQDYTEFVQNNQ